MTHILERHHPTYWDGSVKPTQTFFDKKMSVSDIEDAVSQIVTQNRDRLREIGDGRGQVIGIVEGKRYMLGVTDGHVRQFYPL
jgi:hypothetical protein